VTKNYDSEDYLKVFFQTEFGFKFEGGGEFLESISIQFHFKLFV